MFTLYEFAVSNNVVKSRNIIERRSYVNDSFPVIEILIR